MNEGRYIAAIGIFDGVHRGHRSMLTRMKEVGERMGLMPMVVTFKQRPSSVLGRIQDAMWLSETEERVAEFKKMGIEEVVLLDFTQELASLSACEFAHDILMQQYGVGALFLGYDTRFGNREKDDFDQLPVLEERYGLTLFRDEPVLLGENPISSTRIRKSLAEGDMDTAAQLLGHRYAVWGTVVEGRKVGRQLGFPTANVDLSENHKMLPADGVYAAVATIDGVEYKGLLNLGSQPTFDLPKRTLEVHLLDFEGEIYGKRIEVAFVKRIRDIVKFGSREELIDQINKDKSKVI